MIIARMIKDEPENYPRLNMNCYKSAVCFCFYFQIMPKDAAYNSATCAQPGDRNDDPACIS